MRVLYTFSIRVYIAAIRLASLFNRKAALWISGRRGNTAGLKQYFESNDRGKGVIWFHCSSLGEFEQGRPVIEKIRTAFPGYRILLTFFSPSGYEIRKNYDKADFITYLPADTPGNVRNFLNTVKPAMAFFVKYDYWFNFLIELKSAQVPVFVISALFRKDHYFFKWYGYWFFRQLDAIEWFFVQDDQSMTLLNEKGKTNVTVTGDSRFDRVAEISQTKKELPLIRKFCGNNQVLIAGSTWPEDEELLLPFFTREFSRIRLIIAPHDTSPGRIREITGRLGSPSIKFSMLDSENAGSAGILIIDTVGILAQLYQFATVAYIGGGFGNGIHNIQEPVAFGVPVIFGPKYHKFTEAVELIKLGGAFSVRADRELKETLDDLLSGTGKYEEARAVCRQYIEKNRGATGRIIKKIESTGFPFSPP